MRSIEDIKRQRDDLSTFLIHLTRDTESGTAGENLINILNTRIIEARNPKGLCYNWGDEFSNNTKSVCFTETPLNYVRYLFDIEGREIHLKPYGLVFSKASLQEKGANPVFYINTYGGQELKNAFCRVINSHEDKESIYKIIPYIDIFGPSAKAGKKYDFYWEREWRYSRDLTFTYEEVVVGICNEAEVVDFDRKYNGIKFISPSMSMQEMIEKISKG